MIANKLVSAAAAAFLAVVPVQAMAETAQGSPKLAVRAVASSEAIAQLVRVWGFVKYHHTDAREGRLAMDQAFFELYPKIARAGSKAEAERILMRWLDEIGAGAPCDPCGGDMMPEADEIALIPPTNSWVNTLSDPLAARVKAIFENRSGTPANFQLETARGVGNALFPNEADYKATARDDPALRMLGLARAWNVLRYWFPYRDIMDQDVQTILEPAITEVLAAKSSKDYQRAMVRLAVEADDGHARILAYRNAVSPGGECILPYTWRFAEDQLVVDGLQAHEAGLLKRGDIVRALDGASIADLRARYLPTIPASNEASRLNGFAYRLTSGECETRTVTVERDGKVIDVAVEWLAPKESGVDLARGRERPGDTIQQLDGGITYVRFPMLKKADLPKLLATANAGSGVVLDMRGYMRDYLIYDLGSLLAKERAEFALFTQPNAATPGLFTWTKPVTIEPAKDGKHITVPVVALIDESAASSPEYHAMAWRAAGVTLIGSPTAGADGNVSTMPLPMDGAGLRFSGVGVLYPDRGATQRVGIVPDITVKPTVAGIAAGRDEVLERALQELRSMRDEQP